MRKVLAELMERAAEWPEIAQAELVESMLDIEARHGGVYKLDAEERAAIKRDLKDLRDGKLANDAEIAAVFDRYRLG